MNKVLDKLTPSVSKRVLFFAIAILWSIASIRILNIGSLGIIENTKNPFIFFVIGFVGFVFFFRIVFFKVFIKHTKRIVNKEKEKVCLFSFLDFKGYILMICLISLGVFLKITNIIPMLYLGTFYISLGLSLLSTAISFVYSGIRYNYMEIKHKIKKV